MAVKIFKKEDLLEMLDEESENLHLIRDEIYDTGRWTIYHAIIFKEGDQFYHTTYGVGATEQQDEYPWEYEKEVRCVEVFPEVVEKTVFVDSMGKERI